MKKLITTACLILITIGIKAQSSDDIALVQSLWGKEKRAIVEEYMNLSPAEEGAFWADYDAYDEERKKLGKERIEIISAYVDNYATLSDEKASELMNQSISNTIAIQKLTQKTFKKMSKSISAIKAAKFVQLENYFFIAVQMYIQENLPFIGELDDMRVE